MKQQLIDNLKLLAKTTKQCPYLSMRVDIPGKIILKMGKYISQDEMESLLAEFGNHAGLSYRISVDASNSLTIEIFISSK